MIYQRNYYLSLLIVIGLLITGCQHFSQPTDLPSSVQSLTEITTAKETSTPSLFTVSTNTTENSIIQIENRLLKIETQLALLQNQIDIMRQQQISLTQLFNVETSKNNITSPNNHYPNNTQNNIAKAHQLYKAGLYSQVIKLLKKIDNSHNPDQQQEQMLLLLSSHAHLNNCESVINLGQRFSNQFPQQPRTAQALYLVAQCQQHMQQNDIARDTYQRIINSFPKSSFANKARQQLKRK